MWMQPSACAQRHNYSNKYGWMSTVYAARCIAHSDCCWFFFYYYFFLCALPTRMLRSKAYQTSISIPIPIWYLQCIVILIPCVYVLPHIYFVFILFELYYMHAMHCIKCWLSCWHGVVLFRLQVIFPRALYIRDCCDPICMKWHLNIFSYIYCAGSPASMRYVEKIAEINLNKMWM